MAEINTLISEYAKSIRSRYKNENSPDIWYPMFSEGLSKHRKFAWAKECNEKFSKGTPNRVLYDRWYFSECGAVTALAYCRDGSLVVVGHATGLIQLRHGGTGVVLSTLRNIQFPPKPVYALQFSPHEPRVCYAACTDSVVYRIEVPNIEASVDDPPEHCIRSDPAVETLSRQFYGSPATATAASPFVNHRSAALSLGVLAEGTKLVVGYADASLKIFDVETQEVETTYKVHKLRVQYIPRKLQRMHVGQVCAVSAHPEREHTFASAAWDNTLRIWDARVKIGCMMTFEGVNVCGDSIDLHRDYCLVGSWQPTEALTVWDLAAKKRLNIIRVQNRRPDVDGEYIYACRYWRSYEFNRKGKYGIIGGSGTNCVEVINLHNRYIAASYPTPRSVLAIASHGDRIAFGGTAPVFSIVTFHDPKHEPHHVDLDDPWTWVRDKMYEVDDIMIDMEPVPNYDYPIRDEIEF
ncbi:uncharacterized protein LOC121731556 isoform X2 [Aricia agestis]|uniref:uncharacterized protein LOC121731556 isoform X2 n=1 Tax=Aricia agestis TaxID=91739 RepID=UPI001C201602|nr:uncharacterized protein LOC121731556 isoform X2 [Aricia agestis]